MEKINRIIIAEILIMSIISIDMISTAIAFKYGFEEGNKFMQLFYNLGLIGFVFAFIFDVILFSIILIFLPKLWQWIYKLILKEQMPKKLDNIIFWMIAVGIIILESYTIIKNIITMTS